MSCAQQTHSNRGACISSLRSQLPVFHVYGYDADARPLHVHIRPKTNGGQKKSATRHFLLHNWPKLAATLSIQSPLTARSSLMAELDGDSNLEFCCTIVGRHEGKRVIQGCQLDLRLGHRKSTPAIFSHLLRETKQLPNFVVTFAGAVSRGYPAAALDRLVFARRLLGHFRSIGYHWRKRNNKKT
jgi:hypothetical protein